MVKILHCADIHLDCPFTTLDLKSAEVMRAQLRGAFTSMMLRARTNNVDIILMAGDIFDCDYVTKETVELLKREFSQAENIKIVITPGNHDPFTEESVWNKVIFPENVYIFKILVAIPGSLCKEVFTPHPQFYENSLPLSVP